MPVAFFLRPHALGIAVYFPPFLSGHELSSQCIHFFDDLVQPPFFHFNIDLFPNPPSIAPPPSMIRRSPRWVSPLPSSHCHSAGRYPLFFSPFLLRNFPASASVVAGTPSPLTPAYFFFMFLISSAIVAPPSHQFVPPTGFRILGALVNFPTHSHC